MTKYYEREGVKKKKLIEAQQQNRTVVGIPKNLFENVSLVPPAYFCSALAGKVSIERWQGSDVLSSLLVWL